MGLLNVVLNPAKRTVIAVARVNPNSVSDTDTTVQDYLVIDAAMSITHGRKIQITQFEVESGSDITDNIRIQNDELTIDGIISNNPISLQSAARGVLTNIGAQAASLVGAKLAGSAGGAIGSIAGSFGGGPLGGLLGLNGDTNRVKTAFDWLEALKDNKTPFTVITGLKVYYNMFFTSLSFPRDPSVGNSLKFSAQLQAIRTVDSQTIKIKRAAKKAAAKAAPQQDIGKQKTEETVEKRSSLLFKGFKATGVVK